MGRHGGFPGFCCRDCAGKSHDEPARKRKPARTISRRAGFAFVTPVQRERLVVVMSATAAVAATKPTVTASVAAMPATMESAMTAPAAMSEGIGDPEAIAIAVTRAVIAATGVVVAVTRVIAGIAAVIYRAANADADRDMCIRRGGCDERQAERRTRQHERADCIFAEVFHSEIL